MTIRANQKPVNRAAAMRNKSNGKVWVSRCLCDHPVVGFGLDGEPYSRAEAWIWLLQQAAWKRRTVAIGNVEHVLERGELLVSERDLAREWNWTRKRVRCFVTMLRAHDMLKRGPAKGAAKEMLPSLISICNYDDYQSKQDPELHVEGPSEGPSTPPIRGPKYKNKDSNKVNKKKDPQGDPAQPPLPCVAEADVVNGLVQVAEGKVEQDPVKEAFQLWNALADEAGLPKAKLLTAKRRSKIKERLAQSEGLKSWHDVLNEIRLSPFLRGKKPGRNGRAPFKAHLDFVVQEESFAKLTENHYSAMDGIKPGNGKHPDASCDTKAEVEARLAAQAEGIKKLQARLQAKRESA